MLVYFFIFKKIKVKKRIREEMMEKRKLGKKKMKSEVIIDAVHIIAKDRLKVWF